MNICNYVRLERADKAVEYFLQHFVEKEIRIHKIALVSEKQEILWEI
jgi:ribosomal protein L31E